MDNLWVKNKLKRCKNSKNLKKKNNKKLKFNKKTKKKENKLNYLLLNITLKDLNILKIWKNPKHLIPTPTNSTFLTP